ncbi:Aminotransferase-like mobile domain containing protein [Trema orientale]|uniref:Aminotransferase-like mobile domain containing protein n=1 Tax=Trema orientale TaxID=63057 RepID=A0A2P5F7M8_TREOI|nr:Aminotransferase-like mobile domain containing protein [Trema orientale]
MDKSSPSLNGYRNSITPSGGPPTDSGRTSASEWQSDPKTGDDDSSGSKNRRHCTRRRRRPVSLGHYGIKRRRVDQNQRCLNSIRLYPADHLSHRGKLMSIKGCGNPGMILKWYDELPKPIKDKVHRTGFKHFIDGLSISQVQSALIQCLAEKWWNTTHTFHLDNLGEMTMTPKDFAGITGLTFSGKSLKLDKSIHRNKKIMQMLMGEPILDQRAWSVEVGWLYQTYRIFPCKTGEEEDIVVRAFILALIGSTLFARPNNKVHFYYLPMLTQFNKSAEYNWGAAGLAFLYQQMDDLCRGNTDTIGGNWRAWEPGNRPEASFRFGRVKPYLITNTPFLKDFCLHRKSPMSDFTHITVASTPLISAAVAHDVDDGKDDVGISYENWWQPPSRHDDFQDNY